MLWSARLQSVTVNNALICARPTCNSLFLYSVLICKNPVCSSSPSSATIMQEDLILVGHCKQYMPSSARTNSLFLYTVLICKTSVCSSSPLWCLHQEDFSLSLHTILLAWVARFQSVSVYYASAWVARLQSVTLYNALICKTSNWVIW